MEGWAGVPSPNFDCRDLTDLESVVGVFKFRFRKEQLLQRS